VRVDPTSRRLTNRTGAPARSLKVVVAETQTAVALRDVVDDAGSVTFRSPPDARLAVSWIAPTGDLRVRLL